VTKVHHFHLLHLLSPGAPFTQVDETSGLYSTTSAGASSARQTLLKTPAAWSSPRIRIESPPEKEERNGGPDNLWGLAPGRHAVIELKTDVTRPNPVIIKSEAEQLVHSLTWYSNLYGDDPMPEVVLFHPSSTLSKDAHVPAGTRIVTEEELKTLRTNVKAFTDELASNESWTNAQAVSEGLVRNRLTAEQVWARHSRKPLGARK
jgi:hypothetical protein